MGSLHRTLVGFIVALVAAGCAYAGSDTARVSELGVRMDGSAYQSLPVPVYRFGYVEYFGDIAIADVLVAANQFAETISENKVVLRVTNYQVYPVSWNHPLRDMGFDNWGQDYFGITFGVYDRTFEAVLPTNSSYVRVVDGQFEKADFVTIHSH